MWTPSKKLFLVNAFIFKIWLFLVKPNCLNFEKGQSKSHDFSSRVRALLLAQITMHRGGVLTPARASRLSLQTSSIFQAKYWLNIFNKKIPCGPCPHIFRCRHQELTFFQLLTFQQNVFVALLHFFALCKKIQIAKTVQCLRAFLAKPLKYDFTYEQPQTSRSFVQKENAFWTSNKEWTDLVMMSYIGLHTFWQQL